MYPEFTDETLADLLKANDPQALEALFNRYYKSLCQYCAVYTGNFEVAEEIIADLFIRLWDNRQEAEIAKIKNYLFAAARNSSINYKQRKKAPVDSIEDIDAGKTSLQDHQSPFNILSGKESYQKIMKGIDLLPSRQREVLLMSRIDNLDKHRISELLGISVRTVETTLYQSIKELRQLLKGLRDLSSSS